MAKGTALAKSITWLQDRLLVNEVILDLVSFFDTFEQDLPDATVDPYMSVQLDDLACMDELRVMCTWSQLRQHRAIDEGLKAYAEECGLPHKKLHFERKNLKPESGRRLGRLLRDFCELPWPKGCRDQVWLEKATECRRRLATFWKAMRDEWVKGLCSCAGAEVNALFETNVLPTLMFVTSPVYMAELELEHRENIETQEALNRATEVARRVQLARLANTSSAPWVAVQPEDLPKRIKHTKAKAARSAADNEAANGATLSAEITQLTLAAHPRPRTSEKIHVNPETLSVIKQMYGPANANKSGVRWVKLVRALTDAGFVATEGAGSAVQFSSDKGCIDFHRPHPDPTVDPIMLHMMGRRLRKWFDWDLDRFALRTKVEGANDGHREGAAETP